VVICTRLLNKTQSLNWASLCPLLWLQYKLLFKSRLSEHSWCPGTTCCLTLQCLSCLEPPMSGCRWTCLLTWHILWRRQELTQTYNALFISPWHHSKLSCHGTAIHTGWYRKHHVLVSDVHTNVATMSTTVGLWCYWRYQLCYIPKKEKTCLSVSIHDKDVDQICWGSSSQCIVLKQNVTCPSEHLHLLVRVSLHQARACQSWNSHVCTTSMNRLTDWLLDW